MVKSLKTAQKVKSARGLILLNFPCKAVPFYDVPCCMLHMPGKSVKSSVRPIERLAISTFEQGVMTILLKTAQKLKGRAGIEDHLMNASPVGLPPSNVGTSVHTYLGGLFIV